MRPLIPDITTPAPHRTSPAEPRQERLDPFDPHLEAPHASVYLRPVPLLELAASIDAGEPGARLRERLARALAFG